MSEKVIPVTVNILDKDYRIACSKDERDDLLVSAEYLDHKMRELKDNGKLMEADKIAVVAALNIAHELNQLRAENSQLGEQLDRLGNLIDQSLETRSSIDH